jgi:hypothetical protein
MAKKLTEIHPLTIKLRLLEKFMDEIKISIHYNGHCLEITDTSTGVSARYLDNESGSINYTVPDICETKLTIE